PAIAITPAAPHQGQHRPQHHPLLHDPCLLLVCPALFWAFVVELFASIAEILQFATGGRTAIVVRSCRGRIDRDDETERP
ncbi:MAG: hypothetical protein ACU0CB_14720, partial [Roseovarius sp.]